MIISLILITFSLDNILRSVGESWCWSFSGLNPNNDDSRQVAKKTAFFTNSWTPKTSSFHSRGVLLQWRVMWGCSTLTYNSDKKVNTSFILSIDFHILSSLELCIPVKCHKCTVLKTWVNHCLVPRPRYCAWLMCSRSVLVSQLFKSQIHHRNALTMPRRPGKTLYSTGTTRQSKSQNQNVFSTFSHPWNAYVSPFWPFYSRWLKWQIYSFNACSCIWSSFILWPSWIWFGNSRNVWWLFQGILWGLSQGDTQRKRL